MFGWWDKIESSSGLFAVDGSADEEFNEGGISIEFVFNVDAESEFVESVFTNGTVANGGLDHVHDESIGTHETMCREFGDA